MKSNICVGFTKCNTAVGFIFRGWPWKRNWKPTRELAWSLNRKRIDANGLGFHVASCGEGERLALCLHGFPESWYSWRHQLPVLARQGYRVWAPDLRGYGETDRPSGMQDYALEKLFDDVAGLRERMTNLASKSAAEIMALYHFPIRGLE